MLQVPTGPPGSEGMYLLDVKPMRGIPNCVAAQAAAWAPTPMVNHDNFANRMALAPAMIHSNFCPINF